MALLLIVLVVIILFAIFLGLKSKSDEGGKDMVKKVFIYVVLFATLMMIVGGGISAFMAVADIVSPAPYYQSFDEYKNMIGPEGKAVPSEVKLTEEQLRNNYNTMVSAEKERQKSRATNTLIKSFGWIIIPLPVFLYSKRLLKKQEE
jgi:hypothetical protein